MRCAKPPLECARVRRQPFGRAGQERIEPQQPARGHGRRAIDALGAGQQHFGRAHRLLEIVGGKADLALRRRQAEALAHRAVEPGIDRAFRRPGAFVEAAQDQQVGLLQARFQRPPDGEARMLAEARPHRHARQQLQHQRGEILRRHRRQSGEALQRVVHEIRQGLAGFDRATGVARRAHHRSRPVLPPLRRPRAGARPAAASRSSSPSPRSHAPARQ